MITLQDAVDDLYRIAIIERKSTSKSRLDVLADYCVEQLEARRIKGVAKELPVSGIGREKKWDVAWSAQGKVRLGISLKSILRNLSGTVPNRVDELQGEVANVQLLSPEIVTGYIMIFNGSGNGIRKDGQRWIDVFRQAISRLSGRNAPAWAAGMVEASAIVEVDFSRDSQIVDAPDMSAFFDRLTQCIFERNPEATQ